MLEADSRSRHVVRVLDVLVAGIGDRDGLAVVVNETIVLQHGEQVG